MLQEMLEWWQYNFWLRLAGLVIGTTVTSPLLSKRSRKWFSRSNLELEGPGVLLIVLAITAVGFYKRLSAGAA
jgi:hypothetical protein